MSFLRLLLAGLFLLPALLFSQRPGNIYHFSKAERTIYLPDTLREISDLCLIDSSTVACIQDENGIIFFLNLNTGTLTRQFTFSGNGDYEGIAFVRDRYYVLRSDGVIFEVVLRGKKVPMVQQHHTQIPASDNEGLFYDEAQQRLLIACKSKKTADLSQKNKRFIYAFDLQKKSLEKTPAFIFDVAEVVQFARTWEIPLIEKAPKLKTKKNEGPVIRFAMSAIAIQPLTQHLYVLSAEDYLLLIYDLKGQLLDVVPLPPHLCNKAEGIAFMKNGTLLISNEGQQGSAGTILIFPVKKD
jgi:uncharacterized protein YjiK